MYRGLMRKIKKYETGEREKYCLDEFRVRLDDRISRLDHCGGFQSQARYMQIWESRVPSKSAATWNANSRFSVLVLPGWILLFELFGSKRLANREQCAVGIFIEVQIGV